MSAAREDILARIRTALGDQPAAPPVVRDYRAAGAVPSGSAELVDRFAERVADYRAEVVRLAKGADVAAAVTARLTARRLERVVVPGGFPDAWQPLVELVAEPVSIADLDDVGAVISTCAVAVAETGTIVLDAGPGMGTRALTLVPDYHLVIVRADQIVAGVADAVAALDPTRPLTWISGPSATSDIELDRVEGVHGPRTLDVVIC